MSRGSYFTIYRKLKNDVASKVTLDVLKNEYYLENKSSFSYNKDATEEELREDIPMLMNASFTHNAIPDEENCYVFYDKNGVKHIRLLDFHFNSTFAALKDEWCLDPTRYKTTERFVSRNEAEKMLQAIKYILSEKYSKEFENVLSNEYVEIFGRDYFPFTCRFNSRHKPIYIEKIDDDSYQLNVGDMESEAEIDESNATFRCIMNRVKTCLEAFLYAEPHSYDDYDLVLTYSVYG